MIKSVTAYIGKYKKYTVIASFLTTIGIIANVVPYIFLYQLIVPLTQHELPDIKFVIVHVAAIFICLALLTLAVLPLGILGMSMMMKAGMSKMNAYYESAKKMNNTIIEYVNGMEAIKVFNKDGDSFRRFGEAVRDYRDFNCL